MKLLLRTILLVFLYMHASIILAAGNEIHAVVYSKNEVVLSSILNAVVNKIDVTEGQEFNKDEFLLGFNCSLYHSDKLKADADLDEANARLKANKRLVSLGGLDEVTMQESTSKYMKAQAEQQKILHLVENCTLKAPFQGQVDKLLVRQHQLVNKGDPLIKIIDNQHLLIRLYVPSKWLQTINIGSKFKLKVHENSKEYNAVVKYIVKRIDPLSRTVKVIADVIGTHKELYSGMSGVAIFDRSDQNGK